MPSKNGSGAVVRGHWHTLPGRTLDQVRLTNTGSVPLFNLHLVVPGDLQKHVQLRSDELHSKLPVGETMTSRAWTTRKTMGPQGPAQFELRAVGELEDGTSFEQDVYFDAG